MLLADMNDSLLAGPIQLNHFFPSFLHLNPGTYLVIFDYVLAAQVVQH